MAIPEAIKAFKPTEFGAVEIRNISGHFYVYEISSKWDPVKKKARKVTGKSVGKITLEDGFIPNSFGMRRMMPLHPIVKNYGAYAILQQLSGTLEAKLKECFPDIYREISVIAMLQLITGCRGKRIKHEFEASYLNDIHPDLACSDYTVRTLIGKLGSRSGDMASFMRSYMKSGSKLMFDGTVFSQELMTAVPKRAITRSASRKLRCVCCTSLTALPSCPCSIAWFLAISRIRPH